jgi:hypothetical protein
VAISEPYVSTGTSISTTEISLVSGTSSLQSITDDGIYQVFIEVSALAPNDEFTIAIKEKVYAAATQRIIHKPTLLGQQAEPIWVSPSLALIHGWDVTIIRVAGADRTLAWSIRKVV